MDFLRNDFSDHIKNSLSKLLGGKISQKRELAKMANPLRYIDKTDPPFLIMHGTADQIVPYTHSVLLKNALKRAGVSVKLISIEGADHGDEEDFESKENLQKVYNFFDIQLRREGDTHHQ